MYVLLSAFSVCAFGRELEGIAFTGITFSYATAFSVHSPRSLGAGPYM